MIFPIQFIDNWSILRQNKHVLLEKDNKHGNGMEIGNDYKFDIK